MSRLYFKAILAIYNDAQMRNRSREILGRLCKESSLNKLAERIEQLEIIVYNAG